MNVRLYETGVNDMAALEAALQAKTYSGGTLRGSSVVEMIDVRGFCLLKLILGRYN